MTSDIASAGFAGGTGSTTIRVLSLSASRNALSIFPVGETTTAVGCLSISGTRSGSILAPKCLGDATMILPEESMIRQ
jgi:hypothetical protein